MKTGFGEFYEKFIASASPTMGDCAACGKRGYDLRWYRDRLFCPACLRPAMKAAEAEDAEREKERTAEREARRATEEAAIAERKKVEDEQRRLERIAELTKASGIPALFREWDASKGNGPLLEFVEANAAGSLWLMSRSSGRCKTRSLCHAALGLIQCEQINVIYVKTVELLKAYSRFLYADSEAAVRVLTRLKTADVLILDDIDKATVKDRGAELVFELLDCRWERGHRCWLTSNSGGAELEKVFGERGPYLRRRLAEFTASWDADAGRVISIGPNAVLTPDADTGDPLDPTPAFNPRHCAM